MSNTIWLNFIPHNLFKLDFFLSLFLLFHMFSSHAPAPYCLTFNRIFSAHFYFIHTGNCWENLVLLNLYFAFLGVLNSHSFYFSNPRRERCILIFNFLYILRCVLISFLVTIFRFFFSPCQSFLKDCCFNCCLIT